MDPNPILFVVWSIILHIITPLGIFIRLNWCHTIVGLKLSKPFFVTAIILSVICAAGLARAFITGSFETLIPTQLNLIPTIASIIIIKNNMDDIPHKSAIPFFKVYIILIPIIVFVNVAFGIFDTLRNDLDLTYITATANEILNIILVLAIVRFFAETYFSHKSTEQLLKVSQAVAVQYSLTEREIELIEHLFEGMTAKEIGEAMFITAQTAKNYRSRIYQKLDVRNKIELIKLIKSQNHPEM